MRRITLIFLALCVSISACDDKDATPGLDVLIVDTATGTDVTAEDVAVTPDSAVEDAVSVEDIATPPADATPEDVAPDLSEPADTTPNDDTTSPDVTPTDVATSNGACDNTADRAELATLGEEIVEGKPTALESVIFDCVMGCLGTIATSSACGVTCMEQNTSFSGGCATCFGEIMQCTFQRCTLQCIGGASDGCDACRDEKCMPAFEECAGVAIPTATP